MSHLRTLAIFVVCLGLGVFWLPAVSQTQDKEEKDKASYELPIPRVNKQPREANPPKADVAGPSSAQADMRAIMRLLKEPIETKGLQDRIKLKTALELFSDRFGGRLPILVDKEAFALELGPDSMDPYEEDVVLPPVPSMMSMQTALRLILSQIGKGTATFIIRQNHIEITTVKQASSPRMLLQTVFASYEQRPLKEVLQEFTDQTGLTINIDPRIGEKIKTPITATFLNNALEDALVTVTESADLKFVVMLNSIFVTTPSHARVIKQEEKVREKKREAPGPKKLEATS